MPCNHSDEEMLGYLIGGEMSCDECDEPATHDIDYTVLCCAHYQEELSNPAPPLPPREDFHSDG